MRLEVFTNKRAVIAGALFRKSVPDTKRIHKDIVYDIILEGDKLGYRIGIDDIKKIFSVYDYHLVGDHFVKMELPPSGQLRLDKFFPINREHIKYGK